MGIKPKAIARIGSRSVLIPFPTKGETPLAPPIPLAPHEPTGVTASAGIFTVEVAMSWTDASNNEDGFYVYRNTSNTTTGATLIKTLGAGVQAYTDNAANSGAYPPAEGATYFYWVSSFNAGGESAKSPAASNAFGGETTIWLVPTAPSSLSATAVSSSQINLSWTDNSNNETGFEIYRSTDGITFSSIATVGAGVTTYNSTGLSASTQYYYKVLAYNPGESSTFSNTANATTQAAAGVPTPTYEINFTTDPYVGTRFSRASRGTFVNSSGFIQTAELNGIIQSEDFSTTWVNQGATVTVNATTAPDGSTNADRIVEDATSSNHARRQDVLRGDFVYSCYLKADQRTAAGLRIWMGFNNWMACSFNLSAGTAGSIVSGSGCTITSAASGIISVGNGWYRCWIRGSNSSVSMQHNVEILSSASPTRRADNGAQDYTGNTANGIFAWGAQSEAGNTAPGMYVRTTTVAVGTPRITHDPVTLAPLGLLVEAQATNLCLQSENQSTWWINYNATQTSNVAVAPDGNTTADLLVETNTTTDQTRASAQVAGLSINTTYTYSAYFKKPATNGRDFAGLGFWQDGGGGAGRYGARFDIVNGTVTSTNGTGLTNTSAAITNAGNGWWRCSITFTTSAGNIGPYLFNGMATASTGQWSGTTNVYANYAGDGVSGVLFWGAQLETGTAATSYIPTAAATATRSADACGITSADLGFWNNNAGSVVMEGRFTASSSTGLGLFRAGLSGTNQNMMMSQRFNVNNQALYRVAGTIYNSGPGTSIPTVGVLYKTGLTYTTTDFRGYLDGVAGSSVAVSGTISTNTVEFMPSGANNIHGAAFQAAGNGILRRFRYWNTNLSQSDMQTATT